jgi:hypothetical protein
MDRIGQKKKLVTFSAEDVQLKGNEILGRSGSNSSEVELKFLLDLCQELRLAEHGWCRHGKDKEKCEECK